MRKFKTHISTGRDSTKSVEWNTSYILQFSSFVASHYVHLQTAKSKSSIQFRNVLFLCTNRNNIFRKIQLLCQYKLHKPAELNLFSGDFLRLTYFCKWCIFSVSLINFEFALFIRFIKLPLIFLKRNAKEKCQEDCHWIEINNTCIGL